MRKLAVLVATVGCVVVGTIGPSVTTFAAPPNCQAEAPNPQVVDQNCVYPPAPTTTLEAQIPPPPVTLPVTGADSSSTLEIAGLIVLGGTALVGVAAVRRRKPQATS